MKKNLQKKKKSFQNTSHFGKKDKKKNKNVTQNWC